MKGGRGGTEAVVFFGAVVSHPPPGCVFAVVKCGICLCRALKRQKGERGGEGGRSSTAGRRDGGQGRGGGSRHPS